MKEETKLKEKTSEIVKSKMIVKGIETDIEMTVETTPNDKGGYDTKIKLPVSPLGAKAN